MKSKTIVLLGILGVVVAGIVFGSNRLLQQKKKYIYLTFDDGPLNGSRRVDAAILSEKIPVIVFLVGEHALARPQDVTLYKENKYIEVGNHSFTHANNHYGLYYAYPEGVLKDFIRNMDTLKLTDKIGRLPGRNMWRVGDRSRNDISSGIEAADLLHKNGFKLFGWDLEWHHDSHTAEPIGSAEDIFSQMENLLNNNKVFTDSHIVLLCHDEMFRHTYDESELKKLIDLLRDHPEYEFAAVKDYP